MYLVIICVFILVAGISAIYLTRSKQGIYDADVLAELKELGEQAEKIADWNRHEIVNAKWQKLRPRDGAHPDVLFEWCRTGAWLDVRAEQLLDAQKA